MFFHLRCSIQNNPKQWKKWIALAEFWYNSSQHSSIGMSPFRALYGHEPNLGAMPDMILEIANPDADRTDLLEKLKVNLAAAHNRMKQKADKYRTEKEFQVGDKVLLKLQPYVQQSVVSRPYPKLA